MCSATAGSSVVGLRVIRPAIGELLEQAGDPLEVDVQGALAARALDDDRGEQQRVVVGLVAVGRDPRQVFHRPAPVGAERRDLRPELPGEIPAQLQGVGQPLLLLGEQPEDSGPLAERVLDAVEGDTGEVHVGPGGGGPLRLLADVLDRVDVGRPVDHAPGPAALEQPVRVVQLIGHLAEGPTSSSFCTLERTWARSASRSRTRFSGAMLPWLITSGTGSRRAGRSRRERVDREAAQQPFMAAVSPFGDSSSSSLTSFSTRWLLMLPSR